MSIRKLITFSLLSLLAVGITSGLRMNAPSLLFFDLPLCLIIIFACSNNISAWVTLSLVGGVFLDAISSTIFPLHTITYFVVGYVVMQLMKTRLAQRSLMAVIISSIIATAITFIGISILFFVSVTQWASELIFLGMRDLFLFGAISVALHIAVSVLGIAIVRYSPPEFRLRPYKTRL